jgi:hypothetical protein
VVRAYDLVETQNTFNGVDQLLQAAEQVKKAVPGRRLKVNESWVAEGMVVYHAELIDEDRPGWSFPIEGRLEIKDGRIAREWTYGAYLVEQPHPGVDGQPMARLDSKHG